MPVKLRISGALFHCGRCGRKHSNPFGHTCIVRRPGGKNRLQPAARVTTGTCGRCKKPVTNPLTHVCLGGGDFKRRGAAEKKAGAAKKRADAAAARKAAPKHEYQRCKDEGCARVGCVAYREGYEEGFGDGQGIGFANGQAAGYQAGYAAGSAEGS
jgi:hypothetical protein